MNSAATNKAKLRSAAECDSDTLIDVVHSTIKAVYPKHYPAGVVDFFVNHHARAVVLRDIENELVLLCESGSEIAGTGSLVDGNHITRVFVRPEYHGCGFGGVIMNELERIAAQNHDCAMLDSSVPAYEIWRKRGYEPQEHRTIKADDGSVLSYFTMRKELKSKEITSLDGRIFMAVQNSENGEVSGKTRFCYHQSGQIVWAEYGGGEIVKGFLIGRRVGESALEFTYQHVNRDLEIRTGKCVSEIKISETGKLQLHEMWQWTNGDMSHGNSVVEEI